VLTKGMLAECRKVLRFMDVIYEKARMILEIIE
jgi:hypothetical protein